MKTFYKMSALMVLATTLAVGVLTVNEPTLQHASILSGCLLMVAFNLMYLRGDIRERIRKVKPKHK